MKNKSLLLLVLAYAGFVSLGLPDGLLGVGWPSIRASFDLPIGAVGGLLVMFTVGYLISACNAGRVLARMSVGTLLALSCLFTAVSLLGYAFTSHWRVMVALGTVAGLGAGAIDVGLNTFVATNYSSRTVNWLHACYGIGAATGPLVMTTVLVHDRPWQLGYGLVGLSQLGLAVAFGLTLKRWRGKESAKEEAPASADTKSTLRMSATWLSIVTFFVYNGVEAAVGTWVYSLLVVGRHVPAGPAGLWVSVYWVCLTAGRLLSGLVVGFVSPRSLLRWCMAGIVVLSAVIWLDVHRIASFVALGAIGLFAAPIFPSLIASTPERLGQAHAANGMGFQIAAAVLGQSLLPASVGLFASALGLEVVGPTLVVASTMLFVLHERLPVGRQRGGHPHDDVKPSTPISVAL